MTSELNHGIPQTTSFAEAEQEKLFGRRIQILRMRSRLSKESRQPTPRGHHERHAVANDVGRLHALSDCTSEVARGAQNSIEVNGVTRIASATYAPGHNRGEDVHLHIVRYCVRTYARDGLGFSV